MPVIETPVDNDERRGTTNSVILGDIHPGFAHDETVTTHSGYLVKLGQVRKNWRRRFFELLSNGQLVYSTTPAKQTPRGVINLNEIQEVLASHELTERIKWPSEASRSQCFAVKTTGRTFYMYAPNTQECQGWINAIKDAVARNSPQRSPIRTIPEVGESESDIVPYDNEQGKEEDPDIFPRSPGGSQVLPKRQSWGLRRVSSLAKSITDVFSSELPNQTIAASSQVLKKYTQMQKWINQRFGSHVYFGGIRFPNLNEASFIRVQDIKGPVTRLEAAQRRDLPENMVELMLRLGHSLPRLLISVTGGAMDFELSQELETVIKRGLRRAAGTTSAWVVSGGTHTGIMKYVGDAMADTKQSIGVEVPVIGIATWNVINGRNQMKMKGGETRYNHLTGERGKPSASLDINHSHFFLVTDGTKDEKFGLEVDVKDAFEAALKKKKFVSRRKIDLLVPLRFVMESRLLYRESTIQNPQYTVRLAEQLAEILNTKEANDENSSVQRLTATDIFALRVNVVERKGRRLAQQAQLSFQVPNRRGVKKDIISALKAFTFDHDSNPLTPPISLEMPGDPPVVALPAKHMSFEIFKDSTTLYSILLVVEGGPVTLQIVGKAVTARTPVVVIEGSGRVADILSYAWRFLHDDSAEGSGYTRGTLIDLIRKVFPKKITKDFEESEDDYCDRIDKKVEEVLEVVIVKDRMVVYSLDDKHDIDDSMLKAMLLSIRPETPTPAGRFKVAYNKLHLSMLFGRADIAWEYVQDLRSLSSYSRDHKADFKRIMSDALLWSIISNKPEFVKLLLPQVDNICHFLYDDNATRLVQMFEFGKRNYVDKLLQENEKRRNSFMNFSGIHEKIKTGLQRMKTGVSEDTVDDDVENINQTINALDSLFVNLIFDKNPPQLPKRNIKRLHLLLRPDGTPVPPKEQAPLAFHDLMLWAVLMNRYRLAELFWQAGGHSIPSALIASRVFTGLSEHPVMVRTDSEEADKMARMSLKFEVLARGVLNACFEESQEKAQKILRTKLTDFRLLIKAQDGEHLDCLELAKEAKDMEFMSHPACQQRLTKEWYGNLNTTMSNLVLFMNICIPLLLVKMGPLGIKLDPDYDIAARNDTTKRPHYIYYLRAFLFAPITKFYMDVLSFIGLILLYSYVVLSEFQPTLSLAEQILAFWFFVLICEELRQSSDLGFIGWLQDRWNQMDFLMYSMYVGALVYRLASEGNEDELQIAKLVHVLNLIQVFLRSLRIYAVNSVLGPKLIMLGKMINDMFTFIMLFIVFMLSYGIATEALLFPNQNFDEQTVSNIFYRPFFQMFGELFLEDIQGDSLCIGLFPFTSCGNVQWIVIVLTGVYLMTSNILLVNLLIAMFSSTYDHVQASSLELWRFQFYELLEEYRDKPILPVPLSILQLFPMAIRWMLNMCGMCRDGGHDESEESIYRTEHERNQLEKFQEKHTEMLLEHREAEIQDQDSQRLNRLEGKIHRMQELLTELHVEGHRLNRKQTHLENELFNVSYKTESRVERRLTRREAHFAFQRENAKNHDPRPTVNHIVSCSAELNTKARSQTIYPSFERKSLEKSALPANPRNYERWEAENFTVLFTREENKPPKFGFFEAELSSTGLPADFQLAKTADGQVARRVDVPDDKVKWEVTMDDYSPLDYTATTVLFSSPESPCFKGLDKCPNPPHCFKFADPIAFKKVVAASEFGDIQIDPDSGRPLNPVGRTGLRGRGVLFRWGVNVAMDQIITRFKRNSNGLIMQRQGRNILEFVAIKRKVDNKWALPGSFVRPKGTLPVLAKAFGVNEKTKKVSADLRDLEKLLLTKQVRVFKGYMDDVRNTDNAWIETEAFNVHDETGEFTRAELMQQEDPITADVAWVVAHRDLRLFADHKSMLEHVAAIHESYW